MNKSEAPHSNHVVFCLCINSNQAFRCLKRMKSMLQCPHKQFLMIYDYFGSPISWPRHATSLCEHSFSFAFMKDFDHRALLMFRLRQHLSVFGKDKLASPLCHQIWLEKPLPIGSMYAIYGNIYHQYTQMLASIYHTTGSVFQRPDIIRRKSSAELQSPCLTMVNRKKNRNW